MNRMTIFASLLGVVLGLAWQYFTSHPFASANTSEAVGSSLQLARANSNSDLNLSLLTDDKANKVAKLYALAELDFHGESLEDVLESLIKIEDSKLRHAARLALLEPLLRRDPQATFARCLALGDHSLRKETLTLLMNLWGQFDHVVALKQINRLEGNHDELIEALVIGYGKMFPGAALELAYEQGLTRCTSAYRDLFKGYARLDPQDAFRLAKEFDDDRLVNATMEAWAFSDPGALQACLVEGDMAIEGDDRRYAFEYLGRAWVAKDPAKALEWASALTSDDLTENARKDVVQETANALAEKHPALAFELVSSSDSSSDGYKQVYQKFAGSDWEAAYASMLDQDGQSRAAAATGLIDHLADQRAEEVKKHLPGLLEIIGDNGNVYSEVFSKIDLETILSLSQRYPVTLRQTLVNWASDRGRTAPAEVMRVLDQLPDGVARSEAYQRTVAVWARTDPQEAAAWVAQQPEGEMSQDTYRNLISNWARHDSGAAQVWLEEQSASINRDNGWKEIADLAASSDPTHALAISARIADQSLRNQVREVALEGLLWEDSPAAEKAIQDLSLSQEAMDRLDSKAEEFAAWRRIAERP